MNDKQLNPLSWFQLDNLFPSWAASFIPTTIPKKEEIGFGEG